MVINFNIIFIIIINIKDIPNEIVCHCPIKDLTYDEAEDFFYTYLYEMGIDSIDLKFEDIYPITGTRLSIIKDFIQEYAKKSDEDFNGKSN